MVPSQGYQKLGTCKQTRCAQDLHPRYELPADKEFGKLKADNYLGTSFTLLSPGANPEKLRKSLWVRVTSAV